MIEIAFAVSVIFLSLGIPTVELATTVRGAANAPGLLDTSRLSPASGESREVSIWLRLGLRGRPPPGE